MEEQAREILTGVQTELDSVFQRLLFIEQEIEKVREYLKHTKRVNGAQKPTEFKA